MPQLKGLVFDLDGTLIDSMSDLMNALNTTLRDHGRRAVTLEEFKNFYGDEMRFIVQRAFSATGTPYPNIESNAYFQKYLYRYRHQAPAPLQVYPFVVDMLETLTHADVKLGICSLKPEEATHWLLDKLGLRRYFKFIGGGDTFGVCKPHAGHLLGVIERLEVPLANCVMIGDRPKDAMMAQAAGVPCLIVSHDGLVENSFNADGTMCGFADFEEALERIGFTIERE